MTKKAISLPERVMDELHERMNTRLAQLPDELRDFDQRGMALWLDEVADGLERDGGHSHLVVALPAPELRHGKRIDPRSLELVVMLAHGPAVALGLDVPAGQAYGELLRVRVRDLVLHDGTRVDTAATVREVLAQTKIEIPDTIGPMLDAWEREGEGQA
jgi:hypothetical protein